LPHFTLSYFTFQPNVESIIMYANHIWLSLSPWKCEMKCNNNNISYESTNSLECNSNNNNNNVYIYYW
jgi:hypothetical protein